MTWHLAPSLAVLRAEVNARHPGRDKTSDGSIGDTAHGARPSDHNPAPPTGVVRALDLDVDGIDLDALLDCLTRDPRVAYLISRRRIWTPGSGWRPYTGSNPHTTHLHVSIRHGLLYETDRSSWEYQKKGPFMALTDAQQQAIYDALVGPNGSPQLAALMPFGENLPTSVASVRGSLQTILDALAPVSRTEGPVPLRQEIADAKTAVLDVQLALTSALPLLINAATTAAEVDLDAITAAIVATIPDTIASDVVDALADRLRRTPA